MVSKTSQPYESSRQLGKSTKTWIKDYNNNTALLWCHCSGPAEDDAFIWLHLGRLKLCNLRQAPQAEVSSTVKYGGSTGGGGFQGPSWLHREREEFICDFSPNFFNFKCQQILLWCFMHAQSCLILCDAINTARQAPLSMGFFRQEYWSGLPFPPPGDLPDTGTEPMSPEYPV